jgi:hypothetical protein
VRETRELLRDARAQEALARQASEGARTAVVSARQAHAQAVAACGQPGFAGFTGGHSVQALVGYCESAARALETRRAQAQQAARDLADHEQRVADLSLALQRAQHRLEQVNEQDASWARRKGLAVEVHADLALEDEPRRNTAPVRAGAL